MINLKRCNYITGDPQSISFGVARILDYLELDGRNIVLLTLGKRNIRQSLTPLSYFVNNKIEYNNIGDFGNIFSDTSVLFRVDLIVVDFWHLKTSEIIDYKDILDSSNIDYIIVAKEYHYKDSDDVNDYHIKKESSATSIGFHQPDSNYIITNKVDGWSSDLDSIVKSHVRDKKIDGIIGTKE